MIKAIVRRLKVIRDGEVPVWAIVDGKRERIVVKQGESFDCEEKIADQYMKYKSVYEEVGTVFEDDVPEVEVKPKAKIKKAASEPTNE